MIANLLVLAVGEHATRGGLHQHLNVAAHQLTHGIRGQRGTAFPLCKPVAASFDEPAR
jgi:hypothetical protein